MLNLILFVGCYIAGFFLAFFSNPAWAFMLYQVVYFMNPLDRWWSYMVPSLSYSFFTVMLMFAVFLKDYKSHQQNKLFSAPQFKWLYLIAAGYIIASSYAVLPDLHKSATVDFVKLVIIMSIAYKLIDSGKKLDGALYAYIAGAAYIGFMVFQVGRNRGDRVEGVGTVDAPDTNGVAAAIAPTLVLVLYYFWKSTSTTARFFLVIAGAFIANAIVLINSRGAFLATAASFAYFMFYQFFSKYQSKHQKASVIGILVLGLIGAAMVIDQSAIDRFRSIKSEGMTEEQETGATRVFFWIAAMDLARDHPFGAGAAGFEALAPDYLPVDIDSGGSRNRAVHSTWFEALSEIGYPGLFFLIMLITSAFRATKKCKAQAIKSNDINLYYKILALEAALIAYIVAMTFLNRFRAEVLHWCILFTACAYNIYVVKQAQNLPVQHKTKTAKQR